MSCPPTYSVKCSQYAKQQMCSFKNGYASVQPNKHYIDNIIDFNETNEELAEKYEESPWYNYRPNIRVTPFIPRYVQLDKLVLKFRAYFRQDYHGSMYDTPRIRYVEILYYMEDDTLAIMEQQEDYPQIKWSRILQRHRVTKNSCGSLFDWRDLNVQQDVTFYGVTYHIYDVSDATRRFYESEGIELNDCQLNVPQDQWSERRRHEKCMEKLGRAACDSTAEDGGAGGADATTKSCSRGDRYSCDSRLDGISLRFTATLVSCHSYDQGRIFVITYYPYDDTLSIFECTVRNSGIVGGRFLRRGKVEKSTDSDGEPQYYSLCDFLIGAKLSINKRCFCIVGAERNVLPTLRQFFPDLTENIENIQNYFKTVDTARNCSSKKEKKTEPKEECSEKVEEKSSNSCDESR